MPATTTLRVHAHELERGRGHADVHAVRWDGPAGGPVIVCVHGLGSSHERYAGIAPLLSRHGTVWAPDLAGFGRTPVGDRSARVEDNIDLVRGFVRAVSGGRPVLLLGHSMGGTLACALAGRHPELVAGLVLLAPAVPFAGGKPDAAVLTSFAMTTVPGLGGWWLARRERRLTAAERIRESLEQSTADPDAIDPRLVRADVRLALQRRGERDARAALLEATRSLMLRLGPGRRRMLSDQAAVACPTLVLQGAQDRVIDERAVRAFAARRSDWDYRVYGTCGHLLLIEDPDLVAAEILRWLRPHDGGG